ncbi:MAG: aminofutalosine synthase MqnE, partial [Sulfuricurvum sp.]
MNVIDKVKRRERLTQEEATSLYDLDLFTLGELADERRRELHGKRTYFNINRH